MTAIELVRRITVLVRGERVVVLEIGIDALADLLSNDPGLCRSALPVACEGAASGPAILDKLLDDLAVLALSRWPSWQNGEGDSDPWLKAASKRAALGLPPRFRRTARELELVRLTKVIDPTGVVLIWEIDPASALRAGPVIEALEWCARHGAPVVAVLPATPPEIAPYDRILYGAVAFGRIEVPAIARFIAPAGTHHASETERQVAAALEQDADLAGLFVCNAPVAMGAWGATARVDLLCSAHRIVVELDGPEHRAEPKFRNDRHRDYELLTAGYLVLRMTNEQVAADLPLAIEKIRAVVQLRRQWGMSR
ncbi:MAG: DUF559 domain-containing protein [Parafilimonas terrae]|nr:DUF559 domain-containing protein [Parafilimonas terrae]